MIEAFIPAIISAVTSLISIILPIVAASTGRNALQKDMELYKQWRDTMTSAPNPHNVECDELTDLALTKYRHYIDLRLVVRSHNRDRSRIALGIVLIVLFLCYIVCQVSMNAEGITDDLLRSLIYLALVLTVIGVFILTLFHKVKKADSKWDNHTTSENKETSGRQ